MEEVGRRIPGIEVLGISNASREGYHELLKRIEAGKTYCLLGSSGVGKSSLLNGLSGQTLMSTDAISSHTGKGRHITTHRELIVLPSGGMLMDNPGMREVGLADSGDGLETTFDQIFSLSKNCRYADCSHSSEKGCAVREALESGLLDPLAFDNFLKLEREKAYFESSQLEKRRKEKAFGKIMKNYKKDLGRNAVPGK